MKPVRLSAKARGFTVIELVIVIGMLIIIAGVAFTRSQRGDVYNPAIARDQIISMSRSAQQKAIGRSDVVLRLQEVGSNLQIQILEDDTVIQSSRTSLANVTLRGDVNVLASCGSVAGGTPVTAGNPFVLSYDSLGDLLQGGPGDNQVSVTTGARMCINGEVLMSVCWSAAGFAYAGNCVDVDE